jgi:glycoside/pentoside/hexuronide:cation symporter, GPH family
MKLSLKEKIGYGFGDAASSLFWKLFSMYLMFFYTDIFGIAAAAVGTMFLVTRIWDAAFDPLVGILGDRTSTRWGKFRPYLLWMAGPFALMGVLTFTTPALGAGGKLVYAYVSYSLMMMVYSLINVPYASLLGVMTSDGKERTTLATFRFIFAFGGSLVVLALAEPLSGFFSHLGGATNLQRGWQLTVGVFAVVAAGLFLFTFAWTRERVKPVAEKTSLKADLADLGKNGPWFVLLGAGIATIFFNSIRDGAAIYYFKYYLKTNDAFTWSAFHLTISWSSLYFVLGQAANILGVVLAKPISDRIGKKNTFFAAMLSATVFSFLVYGATPESVKLVLILQFFISASAGFVFPLLWSMYADTADYSEWKTNRRATGLVFSASSMSQKFGWTLGGAFAGWLLAWYGFQANIEQSGTTLGGIRMMVSVYPAIGALVSGLFMLIYPLKENFLRDIEAELATRRAAKGISEAA